MCSGKRATFGPLVVVLLGISEGQDLIGVSIRLSVVTNVDNVGDLFLEGNKIVQESQVVVPL